MPIPDNAQPNLQGIILIDKPVGPTSMRVVERVRRAAGGARCGHAGTLDPLASGLLVVALGSCTKMLNDLMIGDKRYSTSIDLSAFTDTDDLEGARTEVATTAPPTQAQIEETLASFRGSITQTPPAFSAIKIGGRRSYDIARRGASRGSQTQTTDATGPVAPTPAPTPTPAPRPAMVHELVIRSYEWPFLSLDIHCGKGFYVRSLARELGTALKTGGHCASIRRTWSAPFSLENAIELAALPTRVTQADLIAPPRKAI